jgi:hypothetical protein
MVSQKIQVLFFIILSVKYMLARISTCTWAYVKVFIL